MTIRSSLNVFYNYIAERSINIEMDEPQSNRFITKLIQIADKNFKSILTSYDNCRNIIHFRKKLNSIISPFTISSDIPETRSRIDSSIDRLLNKILLSEFPEDRNTGYRPATYIFFHALMGYPYSEEDADEIDNYIYDLFLAVEEGDLDLLEERVAELKEGSSENYSVLLYASRLMAEVLYQNKKMDLLHSIIVTNKIPELPPDFKIDKSLEENSPLIQLKEKEKKRFENETKNKKSSFGSAVTLGILTLNGIVQAVHVLAPTLLKANEKKINPEDVTLVTSYTKGNPERTEMSKLVVENQKAYAKRHGYNYVAYDENQARECIPDDKKSKECQPQWSKIAIIRNWLKNQKTEEGKEKWIVWLDDDMPVTNPSQKLEVIVKKLRTGSETSVIVTRDPQNWNGNEATSVNTGALLVRCDDFSRNFIDTIWKMRNYPDGLGNTLGTCKNQVCLHEQSALANYLKANPHQMHSGRISVVEPRSSKAAINTIARDNLYVDKERNMDLIFYGDSPEARWRPGDFTGQCSGIPVQGWAGLTKSGAPRNLRLECIRKLIQQS